MKELMKVYLFSDHLKLMRDGGVTEQNIIAHIEPIQNFPESLIEINGKFARACMWQEAQGSLYIEWVHKPETRNHVNHTDEVECPHCGIQLGDSQELEDEGEDYCESCGSTYSYSRDVEVTYSTKIINRNESVARLTTVSPSITEQN